MTLPHTTPPPARHAGLPALTQAVQALSDCSDIDQALALATEAAARLAGAERAWLLFADDQGHMVFGAGRTAAGERLDESAFAPAREAAQAAAKTGAPVTSAGQHVSRGLLAVPLRLAGHIRGVLCVEAPELPGASLEPDALHLLSALAVPVAAAIENARLANALSRANDARSEFVRTVTHELRIPLTSIKGYTDLLKMVGPLNAQQEEFVVTVQNNIERMTALVSDLSDIARIESGRLKLDIGPVDLEDLLGSSLLNLRNKIDARQQKLIVEVPADMPPVRADRDRLLRVVTHLLNNAHKYSPPGSSIRISASAGDNSVHIRVIDTGYGIAPADQPRVFDQFFRSDAPAVREETGWGLGLHLSRRLVEMLGGHIDVHSELGRGSTFTVTLPR
jgi:signal transduction histidine kinase